MSVPLLSQLMTPRPGLSESTAIVREEFSVLLEPGAYVPEYVVFAWSREMYIMVGKYVLARESAMSVTREGGTLPAASTVKPMSRSGIIASSELYFPRLPTLLNVVTYW
jgi:hypothetical protein